MRDEAQAGLRAAGPRVDGERLWASLERMAQIGATPKGGVCRLALTDLDRESRDLFVQWARDAGCTVRVDKMGNVFARRAGRRADAAPVMTGSHADSQPTGGRYDGIYGVLGGLEVVRALNDAGIETERPIDVVIWTNEEGSRFAPAMVSAGVFAGVYSLEYGLSRTDAAGRTIGDELERIGYAGAEPVGGYPVHAAYELHIEQGAILERAGKTIGVVTAGQGQRWYEVTLTGIDAHAGTTPMEFRRDALVGAARMIAFVDALGRRHAPHARDGRHDRRSAELAQHGAGRLLLHGRVSSSGRRRARRTRRGVACGADAYGRRNRARRADRTDLHVSACAVRGRLHRRGARRG
ncbi:N-carbamoyl-L-amino-acid hydrolase [Burkholderia multivorans]|nr:N-carbamoyl-L-amino-acid hydrolase [Burkholderia multivorans]MDR8858893.1 N-carbamoyl-L-amino-acid hydrolase [Burkholderia multivorans]